VAPPFRLAEFDIIYGRGINTAGCLLDIASEMEIVKKSGTWFSYKEERIGQGRDQARNFLEANPDMLKEIESRVKAELGKGPVPSDSKADKTRTNSL
jgi:recA bacterial DNA recombination protein.